LHLITVVAALIGLVVGSFLNVVIYRVPRKESIAFPPSHCPECGRQLQLRELVPILSFIVQRGRCRYCHKRISWQYPLVEAANALLWVAALYRFGTGKEAVLYMVFLSFLLALSVIDLRTQLLPNRLTIPGFFVGLVGRWLVVGNPVDGLLGGIGGLAVIVLIALLSRGGMGLGDAKLMGMIGAFLGWRDGLAALAVGAILGGIVGLWLLYTRLKRRHDMIAYGPFLALGGAAVVLLRPWLVQFIAWL